jgi:hypothetical protein
MNSYNNFQSTNVPTGKNAEPLNNIFSTIVQMLGIRNTVIKHEWKTYVPSETNNNNSKLHVYKNNNNDNENDDDCLESLLLYQTCIKHVCETNNSYFDECDNVFKMYVNCVIQNQNK